MNRVRMLSPQHKSLLAMLSCRSLSAQVRAPPLVYITGEEYSRYAGELFLDQWIRPNVDISKWQFFDLSCSSRDRTDDRVLADCIRAGKAIGAIYKEPTITPTSEQAKQFGLKKAWGSPNGVMRKGWNGISISRDTIHLPGMTMGYKNKCLFDRHAVGGEYGAGYKTVGPGKLTLSFEDAKTKVSSIVDERNLKDQVSAVVVYDNPYDNVHQMAHHFFSRCLEAKVTPYVTTKKTVFKWQESFWAIMKSVFDAHYKVKFAEAGLLKKTGGELTHFLSDVATMHVVRWSDGGWGMCSHNYDGDVLTDEIAQVHRSPGFLTSVLNGVNDDGSIIKEFEASHGTVTDMYHAHMRGEEASLNNLSMMEALIGAMRHSVVLAQKTKASEDDNKLNDFCDRLQHAIHEQMTTPGRASRDLSGPTGLTTEDFVRAVRSRLDNVDDPLNYPVAGAPPIRDATDVDDGKIKSLFAQLDTDKNGSINYDEFVNGLKFLGIAPSKV